MEGARVKFTEKSQVEMVTLIFNIRKNRRLGDLRLNVEKDTADIVRWIPVPKAKPSATKTGK